MRLLVGCWVALAGCQVSVDYTGTRFACAESDVCPDGFDCIAGFCEPEGSAGDAAPTAFERTLTVDNAAAQGPLSEFPLLIRLDATRIEYEVCQPDGSDVRFFDAGGAELPREIERWDPGGASVIWVRVPAIEASATGAELTMRYGDGVAGLEAPQQVWSDFAAVYHLVDGSDSSPSGFDGTVQAAVEIDGFIGPALRFTGVGEHVDLGADRPFLQAQAAATSSAWARLDPGWDARVEPGVIFASSIDNMGVETNSSRIQLLVRDDRTFEGDARSLDSGGTIAVQGPMIPADTWTHLAYTVDFANDRMELFIDGEAVASGAMLGLGPTSADSVSTKTIIGRGEGAGIDLYIGDIDEVRLAHRLRSADFIAADYRSTSDQMVTFGPVTAIP